ncbi:MAG: transcriptional regulator NrdR [Thermaerobacter sp.]|nr:transcriptional regulator NrdR [Thermaerobacter sp.]
MRCPACGYADSRVLDSRPAQDGAAIRRRRECPRCQRRFTTYERLEEVPLLVVKQDGSREVFDRQKILRGLMTACEKRPVSMARLSELVDEVARKAHDESDGEVASRWIGELVMHGLKDVDEVAYVRFASVYRDFADVEKFREEVERLGRKGP